MKISQHGWNLKDDVPNLTNIRYADDMLLFAKTIDELIEMLDALRQELHSIGLEMHGDKTKILTNQLDNTFSMVDIGDGMFIKILAADKAHKYLGRMINLHASCRTRVELNHRMQVAWGKFHEHRKWILDPKIPVGLRLRLFNAAVSPGALYGCSVLALSSDELEKLDIIQRKMLRRIVGWHRIPGEDWESTMHRMKMRVQRALEMHTIQNWSRRTMGARWKYALHVNFSEKSSWTKVVCDWNPIEHPIQGFPACRPRGRPRVRWDDDLHFYCEEELGLEFWTDLRTFALRVLQNMESDFIAYCFE